MKQETNRVSQLIFVAAMLVAVAGGLLAAGGALLGFVLFPIGLLSLIGIVIWALRNWDY